MRRKAVSGEAIGANPAAAAGPSPEGRLEPFAQVGGEDVSLDERVAEEGDAHRTPGVEQRVAEGADTTAVAVILDRDGRRGEACRVGLGPLVAEAVLRDEPCVGGLRLARGGVRLDAFGDGFEVDVEILLVEKDGFGDRFGRCRIVEGEDIREDVGTAQFDASDALRGNEAHGHEHCDKRRGSQPAAVGVVFFGGVHCRFSRAFRGSGRRSRGPRRWRSTPPRGRCGPPMRGPPWPVRAVRPASCGWSAATPRRGPKRCTPRAA